MVCMHCVAHVPDRAAGICAVAAMGASLVAYPSVEEGCIHVRGAWECMFA